MQELQRGALFPIGEPLRVLDLYFSAHLPALLVNMYRFMKARLEIEMIHVEQGTCYS